MIVLSLCATVMTVQFPPNSFLIVACTKSSVSKSTAAVASSRISTRVCLKRARAKHSNCLCPTLKYNNNNIGIKCQCYAQ